MIFRKRITKKRLRNLYKYLRARGYPHPPDRVGSLIDMTIRELGWMLGIKEWKHPSLKIMDKETIKFWEDERKERMRNRFGVKNENRK